MSSEKLEIHPTVLVSPNSRGRSICKVDGHLEEYNIDLYFHVWWQFLNTLLDIFSRYYCLLPN